MIALPNNFMTLPETDFLSSWSDAQSALTNILKYSCFQKTSTLTLDPWSEKDK